jgi:hypothetical protein
LNEGVTVERVAARVVDRLLRTDEPVKAKGDDRFDVVAATLAAQHGETLAAEDLDEALDHARSLEPGKVRLIR